MIDDFEESLRPGYNRPSCHDHYDDFDFCSRVLECSKVKANTKKNKKSKCSKDKSNGDAETAVSDEEAREVIYVVKKKTKQ